MTLDGMTWDTAQDDMTRDAMTWNDDMTRDTMAWNDMAQDDMRRDAMTWHMMTWRTTPGHEMTRMTQRSTLWYELTRSRMTRHSALWHEMTRHRMTRHSTLWQEIVYHENKTFVVAPIQLVQPRTLYVTQSTRQLGHRRGGLSHRQGGL